MCMPNFRLLGSTIANKKKKYPKVADPLKSNLSKKILNFRDFATFYTDLEKL